MGTILCTHLVRNLLRIGIWILKCLWFYATMQKLKIFSRICVIQIKNVLNQLSTKSTNRSIIWTCLCMETTSSGKPWLDPSSLPATIFTYWLCPSFLYLCCYVNASIWICYLWKLLIGLLFSYKVCMIQVWTRR